jgi:Protein of unknown function (DUF3822)
MYDYVDESFRKEDFLENILSIQVSLNGFSFCIRRSGDQKLLLFQHSEMKISSAPLIARRLEDWLNENEIIQAGYKEVHVTILDTVFTLIPQPIDNEQNRTDFMRLMFDAPVLESFITQMENLNIILCYTLPEGLNEVLVRYFPAFRLHHVVESILQSNRKSQEQNELRLLFEEKDMYLTLLQRDKPVLCNSFRINHANDAVYFILTILKQFHVSTRKLSVLTGGKTRFLKELTTTLSGYFSNIGDLNPSEPGNPDEKFKSEFPCLIN